MKALSKTNRNRADKLKTAFDNNKTMASQLMADGEKLKSEHDSFKGEADKKMEMFLESEKLIRKSNQITETNEAQRTVFILSHDSEGHKQYQKRIGLVA